MSQRKHYYLVVQGIGPFPKDMLRYDNAEVTGAGLLLGKPAFLIYGHCTEARWQSFLWSVFEVTRYYPNGDSERGPVGWKVNVQGSWEPIAIRGLFNAEEFKSHD